MKTHLWLVIGTFALGLALNSAAATHYVNVNSTNATAPYTDWGTAATNIQEAIDASTNGDTVLVTNGIYETGGMVMSGNQSNRVALNIPITVQSVNGPWVTTIQGAYGATGPTSARCAWLTNNAQLIGFTLEGGSARIGGQYGGGVWCASSNSVVENCLIVSNSASGPDGAGVYQGTYYSCLISSNNGVSGNTSSGAYQANLVNCTVTSNFNVGAYQCRLTNCIVYFNNINIQSPETTLYSCTTPAATGAGNFTNAPLLFVDGLHLLSASPCIGAGTNLAKGTDIFGDAWANPPSVGCAEFTQEPVIAQPSLNLFGDSLGLSFNAVVSSPVAVSFDWLLNGVPLTNNQNFNFTQSSGLVVTGVSPADAGNYQLVASNAFGVVTSAVVSITMHCVDANSTNPVAPFSTWDTAATNIQEAINASESGDIVLVTNGIYATGASSMDGVSTNRVSINNAIRVQSVNGPWVTTIQGAGATNGPSAVRCAWLTNNAALVGFKLAGGATQNTGSSVAAQTGGGAWCASTNAFVNNCVIESNTASYYGGGAYQGTLNNCLISSNSAMGAYSSILKSCTVVSNATDGAYRGSMINCIVYYNAVNYNSPSAAAYCCTTPAVTGTGNFTTAPSLQLDGVHLSGSSPCIGAGTNVVTGTDIFGQAWANPPSVGCAEFVRAPLVSQPQVTPTGSPVGFSISATTSGQLPLAFFWMENGIVIQNNGHFSSAQSSNLIASGVTLADAGGYQLVVSNAYGVTTSAVAQLVIHTVNATGANPQPPFLTWATAATNIQDAIEAASASDIVLVTNGIYDSGGKSMDGTNTNRVALDKALMVASINGWAKTIIQGAWDPVSQIGPDAVRCAWLTNGSILTGFTLQNGATPVGGGTATPQNSGGGVWCASTNALVANCLLTNNLAGCGGGIAFGTLNNSLVVYNVAFYGGGSYIALLNNCTVVENSSTQSGTQNGAGTYGGITYNSVVVNNPDGVPPNLTDNFAGPAGFPGYYYSNCCTSFNAFGQIPSGSGNITSYPQFLDLYHISINSPCRGAGSALHASGTDLDGEPWNNPPSIGCDEFVVANRAGPLSVNIRANETNVLVSSRSVAHPDGFVGTASGLPTYISWNYGDGPTISNANYYPQHDWTNTGDYTVVFTAYNIDNPSGVSASQVVHVVPLSQPQLAPLLFTSNGFQFQFTEQMDAFYTAQYTTNLTPPVTWISLTNVIPPFGTVQQVLDGGATNAARFYRVLAQ